MKTKNDLMWSISLMVIGITAIILNGSNVIGIELPDVMARIVGAIGLVALLFLVYSSIKKLNKKYYIKPRKL